MIIISKKCNSGERKFQGLWSYVWKEEGRSDLKTRRRIVGLKREVVCVRGVFIYDGI